MDRITTALYETTATSTAGRPGSVRSDGLDLSFSEPLSLGGARGADTSPENLFAAALASCFHAALGVVASEQGIATSSASVRAHVRLGKGDDVPYVFDAQVEVELPDVDEAAAQRAVDLAAQICPLTRAVQGNIALTVERADGAASS